eukprot:scaffold8303_cov277-Pinguiococcus_pyrenoidosus.AAC.2
MSPSSSTSNCFIASTKFPVKSGFALLIPVQTAGGQSERDDNRWLRLLRLRTFAKLDEFLFVNAAALVLVEAVKRKLQNLLLGIHAEGHHDSAVLVEIDIPAPWDGGRASAERYRNDVAGKPKAASLPSTSTILKSAVVKGLSSSCRASRSSSRSTLPESSSSISSKLRRSVLNSPGLAAAPNQHFHEYRFSRNASLTGSPARRSLS